MSARDPLQGKTAAGSHDEHTAQAALFDEHGNNPHYEAELLAIVRRNRAEVERLRSQPYPVGAFVIVYCTIDEGTSRVLFDSGQVIAYYPNVGDGELWVRTPWNDIERIRLHGPDDSDPDAYIVGLCEFYETWEAFETGLHRLYEQENARLGLKVKR
jgi:hypothetical protein